MTAQSLPPTAHPGAVALTVSDLPRLLEFYQNTLGLQVYDQQTNYARLGAGGADLLHLFGDPQAPQPGRATGLYHFAILLPSRADLSRALWRLLELRTPLQGFADHHVSEAIYLADPEGNGIELYRDRPRGEWQYQNGALKMGTDPLDVDGLLLEHGETPPAWQPLPAGTTLGHMHLRVAEIAATERFYTEAIGFDLVIRYGRGATFLSAGGYHHHLGANTWESAGAPPPPPGAVGLRWWSLVLPEAAAVDEARERLLSQGVQVNEMEMGWLARDPAGNAIVLTN